jgi:hypothetical protein
MFTTNWFHIVLCHMAVTFRPCLDACLFTSIHMCWSVTQFNSTPIHFNIYGLRWIYEHANKTLGLVGSTPHVRAVLSLWHPRGVSKLGHWWSITQQTKAWFSSQIFFCLHPSHWMFGHMHGVLNVDEKKLIAWFSEKSWDESFKPN